jgi:hypothetical protein
MSGRIRERVRAERLARVLISDLVAEWGEQIRIGLEKDDLFARVGPQIERARVFYRARVDACIADRERIFDFAVVDVMLARNRAVRPYVW